MSMMEKWHNSADNIIAHFAVICKGNVPFELDWSRSENTFAADLDPTSVNYLEDLKITLSEIECELFRRC
jgi:hypothetical protein